ncbi:MAG TPA: hypothetical protein VII52_04245 [Gemmatimonadaceae bacterium]
MLNSFVAVGVSTAVAVAQAPRVSPADVRAIAVAVIDDVAPHAGRLGARPIEGRQLFLDEAAFFRAMQKVVDGHVPPGLTLARPVTNARSADVIHCSGARRRCQVRNDGIFVKVLDAAVDPASGQVRVRTSVTWDYGLTGTTWFAVDVFLAKTGSEWKVVRHGPYATS